MHGPVHVSSDHRFDFIFRSIPSSEMMIVGVLLYLSCVILSFASSVVGPLERNFSQSQPEHPHVVESVSNQFMKRSYLPPERSLISKTEKDWLEAFIFKLQLLASKLQRNVTSDKESHYLPVAQSSSSPTTASKQEQSREITSIALEDDELVRELESLHQVTTNKPSTTAPNIVKKKETIADEVVELRSLSQNSKKNVKQDSQSVHKFERLKDKELIKSTNVPKVNYWNVSTPLVTPRMENTFLGMPRVLRKHFRYGWHRDPGSRHYPFNHGAIASTIQKLNQNALIRSEMGRAHQAGMSPFVLKSFYMPYPLSQQKNETPSTTEFSEEMKRQLRDGKVLILSDSVVRSNFTS